ncbi:M24 family metallopeptidase [Sphingobium nicotianae]|uniref:Xaa-Pro peptidase family protein n=1 Tax=Sphingobium nicotianae TaxID=2782607 RepID=A0A9X1AJT8_9SPHN|nr:Xaa-Pro peptidase family protein [Sphingobium nicotianae]MBT2185799.1 Xaa-Pro peptidase family protein [Sphingobium nicotianae]
MHTGRQRISRRDWMAGAAGLSLAALARPGFLRAAEPDLSGLGDMTRGVAPIGRDERNGRIARAQTLMKANGIGAVLIEAGSSLDYFTGVQWWRSERLTAAILPMEGEVCLVTPFFEEPSVRQTLAVAADLRVWQEDEDPVRLVAGFLKERGLAGQPVGIEETVRYFAVDGLKRALPDARLVSANPVVRGCRLLKSPAEIALMQAANDVTLAALRWVHPRIERGMQRADIAALVVAASARLGGEDIDALILIGEASAYPHGSNAPQSVTEGTLVLLDCGCKVHGYTSDISRSFVFGAASNAQRKVWDDVARGQQAALAAARLGAPAGEIDDAVRVLYERLGYGPRYRLPGLSHRTGHGIGMDGHEPVNLVHGEATRLAAGMCFSNEPGLYLPGQFGVRLEDCFHMTDAGPTWFTVPPTSIDRPFD